MPKGRGAQRCRRVVDSVEPPSSWVLQESEGCSFVDERLGHRFRILLEQLPSAPGESIPLVWQDWANTKAAYRFLDNPRVSEADILAGHFAATRARASETRNQLLVLHDTTEFFYKREDAEAVGKRRIGVTGATRQTSTALRRMRITDACELGRDHRRP